MDNIEKIELITSLINDRKKNEAKIFIKNNYPHQNLNYDSRSMSIYEKLKI